MAEVQLLLSYTTHCAIDIPEKNDVVRAAL